MIKVYIASPYTKGDIAVNVKRQVDCFNELALLGYAPFAPLWAHFQHLVHPLPYEVWYKLDLEWVLVCDCLLRLIGESSGADDEVDVAMKAHKPVFHTIAQIRGYYENI